MWWLKLLRQLAHLKILHHLFAAVYNAAQVRSLRPSNGGTLLPCAFEA